MATFTLHASADDIVVEIRESAINATVTTELVTGTVEAPDPVSGTVTGTGLNGTISTDTISGTTDGNDIDGSV